MLFVSHKHTAILCVEAAKAAHMMYLYLYLTEFGTYHIAKRACSKRIAAMTNAYLTALEARLLKIGKECLKRSALTAAFMHRLKSTLCACPACDANACNANNLGNYRTKMFEETVRGTLAEVAEHFRQHAPKGEFVIVVAGRTENGKRKTFNLVSSE